MRVSALVALLPALATLAAAAPHPTASKGVRKSLSFGPEHAHAKFESYPSSTGLHARALDEDPKRTAAKFIAEKVGAREGEGFFIRDDVSVFSSLPVIAV